MASKVYKLSEWQDAIGIWRVAHTDTSKYNRWWMIPRALGITLEDYINMLQNQYHASYFRFYTYEDERNSLLTFGFDNYKDAHQFLLDMNRQFRKLKWMI